MTLQLHQRANGPDTLRSEVVRLIQLVKLGVGPMDDGTFDLMASHKSHAVSLFNALFQTLVASVPLWVDV